MKKYLLAIFLTFPLIGQKSLAKEPSYEDCLLQGLKGVSSDAAARLVKMACEGKERDSQKRAIESLTKEFGELIDIDSIKMEEHFNIESKGFSSIQITNSLQNPKEIITYVSLRVYPAEGLNKSCDHSKGINHSYKLSLKSGSSILLVFPSTSPSICPQIESARARESHWKDFSLSGTVKPMAKDPFSDKSLFPPSQFYYPPSLR